MKLKIALISSLFLLSAFAEPIAPHELARILINNPLHAIPEFPTCNDHLADAVATKISDGITEYKLTLVPGNFCEPVTAIVTIIEDMTATYHDGPKTYKTTLEVKSWRK